jgi:hypothetical protein
MAFDRFWSPNEPVPGVTADNCQPTLAVLGDALHLVWSCNRILYHSVRLSNTWSLPVRIVAGEQPAMVAASDGRLHCLFANPFVGNWEIYHITFEHQRWSLPKPVSRTSGISTQPSLAANGNGSLHAVWADSTPGKPVVYYGKLDTAAVWSSAPIPNGRGCFPAIATAAGGDICVAWQDRSVQTEAFDVFCSVLHSGEWGLPDIVSNSPSAHSVKPSLAVNAQGETHLVWLEERASLYEVRHADRRQYGWSRPTTVSTGRQDCRQARIVSNPQDFLQVVWLEGNTLHHRVRPPGQDATWWVPQIAESDFRELSDLAATVGREGDLHVAWSGFCAGETRSLFYARRDAIFKPSKPKPHQ